MVGDEIAFHVMEILSTNHLVECMQETMEPTQRRLMFLYPLVKREKPSLCDYLERFILSHFFDMESKRTPLQLDQLWALYLHSRGI